MPILKYLTEREIMEKIQEYEDEFKKLKENIFINDSYNIIEDIDTILNRLSEIFWTLENKE